MRKEIIKNKAYFIRVGLICFVFILINASSCLRKEDKTVCGSGNSVLLPKDAVDRFFFRDSSYWVYQDSLSGQLDSIWVYKSDLPIINMEKARPFSKGKCYQAGITFYHSTWSNDYEISIDPQTSELGTEYKDESFNIYTTKKNYYSDFALMNGNNYINFDPETGLIDSVSLLKVKGVEFNDILRKNNETNTQQDLYYISYYVKNIGMVKFIRNDKSVWELLRYKVKQ